METLRQITSLAEENEPDNFSPFHRKVLCSTCLLSQIPAVINRFDFFDDERALIPLQGVSLGVWMHGLCYERGVGVSAVNHSEAIRLYTLAICYDADVVTALRVKVQKGDL